MSSPASQGGSPAGHGGATAGTGGVAAGPGGAFGSNLAGARAFRHRNYRLFFTGQLISLVGTWMMTVAQSWLILQLTGDPLLLGAVAAAQFGPVLVLGLFGGIIADSLPKRRTLIATQVWPLILGLIMSALVFTNTVQVWHVLVIAFLLGCRNAVDMPTRQAFVVEMVGKEDIGNAVAFNSAMFNAARVLGPAVGGITIGALGVAPAFLADALSYVAVIVAYLMMREGELHTRPGIDRPTSVEAVLVNLREGLSYVRRTPLVLAAISVVALVSTFGMNFTVVIPPYAQGVLHTDAAGYGFLMSMVGVGSVLSALTIAFTGRTTPIVIALGAITLAIGEIVLAASSSFLVSLAAMFFVGVGGISMAATANTVVQLAVPDQLRGRVMSVYTTVFAGSTPVGGLVTGAIASSAGVPFAIGLGAVLSLATGLLSLSWLRGRAQPGRERVTVVPPSLREASVREAPTAAPATRAPAPRSTGPG
jgi:MFS family permease